MADEQQSYVIFLPTSLDLEKRRAHGTVKIVHAGTRSEQIEMDFPLGTETANGIEAAIRWFEKIRAPREVISG